MKTRFVSTGLLAAVAATLLWPMAAAPRAQSANAVLAATAQALGATGLKTLQVSGQGFDYLFGQQYEADAPWPRFDVPRYELSIDYTVPAVRDDRTRTQGQNPPRGGGNQPIGEQRQIWLASGSYAWNQGGGRGASPAGFERDQRPALAGRLAQIWLTPQGFIQAAIAAHATVRTETVGGARKTRVTFTSSTHAKFEATINEQRLIERIETWLGSPMLGDTLFEAVFQDYKDFGGVKYPTHVIQREGGYPVLDVTITDVKPNVALDLAVPQNIRDAKPPAPFAVRPEKLADGVWSIPVNNRDHTFAIEFDRFIVAVEAPQREDDAIGGIEAIKRVIPDKPIKYIVSTHVHFDHTGGLRAYAAEGATLLAWQGDIPYYAKAWSNPRTIVVDRLAKSGKTPAFEGVTGSRTIADGSQQLVIYHYGGYTTGGNAHSAGQLMVFLPRTKMLIEADSYNPPGNPNNPPTAIPNLVQFVHDVQRRGLDVEQLLSIHDRLAPFAAARKAAEVYGAAQLPPAPAPAVLARTADGKPDLSGIWQVLNTAAWDIQDHQAHEGIPAGQGVVDGNDIPYQPWALAKKKENAANRKTVDPETKCYMLGVPRSTYTNLPFEIFQKPNLVAIAYEYAHTLRYVYTDATPHPKGPIEWWMGDSRGHWDGDTLVVDAVHFNEGLLDRAGNFHSEALHVVERYTPIDAGHINYEVTLDDPKVFTRPWTMRMVLYRRIEPNSRLLEYECYSFDVEKFYPYPGVSQQ